MLEMAKLSTNINSTEYQKQPEQSETTIEGEVLYPQGDTNTQEDLDNQIVAYAEDLENEMQEYLDFIKANPKQGSLKIQAFAARQAVPVYDVVVEVSKNFNGVKKVFYLLKTDEEGIIDGILLPAPDKQVSMQPSETQPFSTYNIQATHPDYIQENFLNVPIFDGVKSIQPIRLKPITDRNS